MVCLHHIPFLSLNFLIFKMEAPLISGPQRIPHVKCSWMLTHPTYYQEWTERLQPDAVRWGRGTMLALEMSRRVSGPQEAGAARENCCF